MIGTMFVATAVKHITASSRFSGSTNSECEALITHTDKRNG